MATTLVRLSQSCNGAPLGRMHAAPRLWIVWSLRYGQTPHRELCLRAAGRQSQTAFPLAPLLRLGVCPSKSVHRRKTSGNMPEGFEQNVIPASWGRVPIDWWALAISCCLPCMWTWWMVEGHVGVWRNMSYAFAVADFSSRTTKVIISLTYLVCWAYCEHPFRSGGHALHWGCFSEVVPHFDGHLRCPPLVEANDFLRNSTHHGMVA
jgi:hypothetical protein